MKILGGATILESFLKAYQTNKTKTFFPCEWFDRTEKVSNKKIPLYDCFFNILRNEKHLEKDYNDFQYLVESSLSREQAITKVEMDNPPQIGAEDYAF